VDNTEYMLKRGYRDSGHLYD